MAKHRRFFYAALRGVPHYPFRPAGVCLGLALIGGWLTSRGVAFGGPMATYGAVGVACVTAWWVVRHVISPTSGRRWLDRKATRRDRNGGVSTFVDISEHASPSALRSRARTLRPSTGELTRWERARVSPFDLGVPIARVGPRGFGQHVWSSCEDVTMRIGGPRMGKSLSLCCHGIDAPGALITTSTRLDLVEGTYAARSDRAVHIFNPNGLGAGKLPSTVRWSVLAGCEDYSTAARIAANLIPESRSVDGEHWDVEGRRVCALYLHAAAIAGGSCRDVMRWLGSFADSTRDEIIGILQGVPGGDDRAMQVRNHFGNAPDTRQCINGMVAKAFTWMSSEVAREIGDAPKETRTLDITRLIVERETLHLLGHETFDGTAPLIAALVGEIGHQCVMLSSGCPGNRLDPPVTMLLDEVTQICPIPLVQWTSHMGGAGVTLHIAVQSLASLRNRWGDNGASAILNNTGSLIAFGGGKDADDLEAISRLTGVRRRLVHERDGAPTEYRTVPVMGVAEIAALDQFEVVVIRSGMPLIVGRAPLASERRGWKPAQLVAPAIRDVVVTVPDHVEVPA